MGKINSKVKGKVGESEFSHYLQSKGFTARRGVQYSGGTDSPDVICEELGMFHLEIKRTEKLQVYKAIEQAIHDCPKGKYRVVAHRQSRKDWLVILRADDFMEIIKDWLKFRAS